jgi:DNA/RNA-binding domain of Phe-tRNA-synthetase-like protein
MKLRIFPEIFSSFPELRLGIVIARGIDNRGESVEIGELIRKKQEEIRNQYILEEVAELPRIQSWRRAYASFGAKPKKHHSSVENLLRMSLEGRDLRPINKIVDIYNYISLLHQIPAGGDDLARVDGDIVLRLAKGDEPFRPLGIDETQTARQGEVIYADEREVLCRRWNWRESEKTKMTEETRDVLLVSEGLPPVTDEEMERIVADLAQMVEKYCGGEISREVLSPEKTDIEL